LASARSGRSLEEGGTLGVADTLGRGVLEATATHLKVAVAGDSLMVVAGGSHMVVVAGGDNPMVVVAGDNPMVVAGDSPMVAVAGVKEVAPTVSGTNPVSQKPT
jgi:hypothetical protein